MHQMSHEPGSPPTSLLLHDGELADVRALLTSLGVRFAERLGAELPEDRAQHWSLVIGSARRILDLQLSRSAVPVQIAILAHDARTLRTSLRRSGATLMVRRPVHPAALRALVLHSLYRGPEKRRSARVNVGAPVRLRVGWRRRAAVLVDLSVGGCRLMSERPIERGTPFRLQLPGELAGGSPLVVAARVLDCALNPDPHTGRIVITASFDPMGASLLAKLQAAVAVHAGGPAICEGARPWGVTGADAEPEPAAIASSELAPASSESAEPRTPEQVVHDERVAALGDEATRVLIGRDLSRSGMRVSPNPLLSLGMKVRLAVHTDTREAPLVFAAVVERDDGERGLALRFDELSEEAGHYLDYVLLTLPLVDVGEEDSGCLITELLETR
jgi:hypothetical protein